MMTTALYDTTSNYFCFVLSTTRGYDFYFVLYILTNISSYFFDFLYFLVSIFIHTTFSITATEQYQEFTVFDDNLLANASKNMTGTDDISISESAREPQPRTNIIEPFLQQEPP